jgi:hypothetical protein
MLIDRPDSSEHAPYFEKYISLVPEGDVIDLLERQVDDTIRLVGGLSDTQALYRYAPGKWSLKEVVGHLADTERVFAYRALRIARNDQTPLPGFDENLFVANAGFDARPLADLVEDFRLVRRATVALFRSFTAEMIARRGISNDKTLSVRALAYITAGHERHHMGIIRERYRRGP